MSNLINYTTMKQKTEYMLTNEKNTITLNLTLKSNHHIDQVTLDNLQRIISNINISQYDRKRHIGLPIMLVIILYKCEPARSTEVLHYDIIIYCVANKICTAYFVT